MGSSRKQYKIFLYAYVHVLKDEFAGRGCCWKRLGLGGSEYHGVLNGRDSPVGSIGDGLAQPIGKSVPSTEEYAVSVGGDSYRMHDPAACNEIFEMATTNRNR
jgi:hypothetical protein